jgi:nitrite reductase/ring-hydroxylating ferredoxin subunit
MGLLRTLLFGRENGIRSNLRGMLGGGASGGGQPDWTPDSSYSAPSYDAAPDPGATTRPEPPRDVTPPEGFEVVLHVGGLEPGEVSEVIAGGTAICVANVDGEYMAVSNTCPHADGPLGEGSVEGSVLTCPYHGWSFDLKNGKCKTNPSVEIQVFEVQIKGDAVCVRL